MVDRQHLLGDRDAPTRARARRSGASPARTRRANRRHRLLRDALRRRRRRRCPASSASSPTTRSCDSSGCSRDAGELHDRRTVRRRRRRRAARRSSPAWPAAPRSRCGCRPAARSAAATASFRRRAAPAGACRSTSRARGRARRGVRVQGDRAHRRAPRLVRPRPRAGGRRCSICCARWTTSPADVDVPHQLARADGLHAGDRRRSSPRAAAGSRRTSICRCSTPAIGCCARCAGRTRSTTTAGWSTASSRACRTRRSART